MVVQTPPNFVRKATASGVASARSANTSTSVLPVTPAMFLPPQLMGGWPVPPSRSLSNLQSLRTNVLTDVLCRLWSHRGNDGGSKRHPLGRRRVARQQVGPARRRKVAQVLHRQVPLHAPEGVEAAIAVGPSQRIHVSLALPGAREPQGHGHPQGLHHRDREE